MFVCLQNNSKSYEWILIKVTGKADIVTRTDDGTRRFPTMEVSYHRVLFHFYGGFKQHVLPVYHSCLPSFYHHNMDNWFM